MDTDLEKFKEFLKGGYNLKAFKDDIKHIEDKRKLQKMTDQVK